MIDSKNCSLTITKPVNNSTLSCTTCTTSRHNNWSIVSLIKPTNDREWNIPAKIKPTEGLDLLEHSTDQHGLLEIALSLVNDVRCHFDFLMHWSDERSVKMLTTTTLHLISIEQIDTYFRILQLIYKVTELHNIISICS